MEIANLRGYTQMTKTSLLPLVNRYDTVDGRNPANHLGCKSQGQPPGMYKTL